MFTQSLVIQPRVSNTRTAKTDISQRTTGSDGKLYKLVDGRDQYKYRVQSEDDMILEAKKTQDYAASITAGKRPQSTNRIRPKRATQGLDKQQRIDNRKYKTQLAIKHKENTTPNMAITNSGSLQPLPPAPPPEATVESAVPEQLLNALNLLQTKYEKNLEVIDILFDEKKRMEQKVAMLESKMVEDANKFEIGIGAKTHEECAEEQRAASGGLHPPKPSEEAVPPSMAVALFADQSVPSQQEDPSSSTQPTHGRSQVRSKQCQSGKVRSHSAGRLRSSGSQQKVSQNDRSGVASVLRRSQDDSNVGRGRSNSETQRSNSGDSRKSVGSFSQSIQMQASIDRFLQRKSLLEQKEKAEQLEQKAYEQAQRERYLRASKNGKEFKEMSARQEIALQKRTDKLKALQQKQKEKEDKEKELRQKKIQDHINKPIPKHELTWKEVEEQNALKIKERKERFKQELLMTVNTKSVASSATSDNIKEKILLLQKEQEEKDAAARKFVAKDPNKVAQQLENAKRAYELSEQKKAEKAQMLRENRKQIMANIHNIPVLQSMEERAQKHAEKQKRKAQETAQKEADAARKAKELEQRRHNRALKQKVPEASRRSTKSATYRTLTVKSNREKELAETQRLQREAARKLTQEKELAAVLRADIAEREHERRAKVAGYVELQGTQEKAAAIAQIARQQYRERLRENRMKIAAKLKDRPSLIQRHEQDMRKKAANSAALSSVAKVVGAEKQELFNAEEKMRLGLDDDDDSLGI